LEVRLIYYELSKEKSTSEINKRILEKKTTQQRHVAAPESATWHADISKGSQYRLTSAVALLTSTLTVQR
jgi:hypothetical protein